MPERCVKVRTVKVEYVCDACGQGTMKPTGFVYDILPPDYLHKCNKCGKSDCFNKDYPYIRYVEEFDADPS
jgi:hypothetical protein